MGKISAVWRIASSWYVSLLFVVTVGIVIGYFVFFEVYPGRPKIAVIDIPFTVITDDSAFVIDAFLDYARERDDIKGVVIKLNSPGGGAAASEQLFVETRKLREEKPVVIAMGDIVASGAYMMSMGANFMYARPSTFVGSVGVVLSFPGPLLPSLPDEQVITTGPFKRGSARRHFISATDQLKQGFAQMVITERGDKLRLSREELLDAQIFPGIEGVRVGLVDAIGGNTDAIEKAADLAGISNYDLVDVNTEVFRILNQKLARILEPLFDLTGSQPGVGDVRSLMAPPTGTGDAGQFPDGGTSISALRRLFLPSGVRQLQQEAPPGVPLEVETPRIYYLYVGPSK